MTINKPADGGITALHMAALYGHTESVQLLLDLGASFSEVTVEDGSTIDLIGSGSTPLHYAACGGNAQCCQVLIARGASLTAENANGWTPLMVARSWHRNWLEGILSKRPEGRVQVLPSSYLSIPLMSIMKIARDSGWRNIEQLPTSTDPCAVCLETGCEVYAEGCGHEFCTRCALYLCSTNSTFTVVSGPPGSIACPLCRHAIVSFTRLPVSDTTKGHHSSRTTGSLALALCTPCSSGGGAASDSVPSPTTPLCVPEIRCDCMPPFGSSSFCSSLNCQRFPLMRLNSSLCMGQPETRSSLVEW
ncbi:putative E3 ubiquitin-protein ligase XBOS32 [Acorus calamus]|uniref:RING-type E3 ubiquitin transferase n=1 Tax=Acorus calamus TaxID=4465 RepID=A0AAV9FB22_ACOCL|nr:putative E3 ubiquitin-protein ligase XBOS32 [Acorus calamus]